MRLGLILLAVALCACARDGKDGQSVKGDKGDPGQSIIGPSGAAGKDGQSIVGPQGERGDPGVDATPVTMIKLCPQAPSYPAVFVEFAICLQNKLYGVYSANGGFLAELPPGQYASNAIGSSCNFTIAANCQVVSQ